MAKIVLDTSAIAGSEIERMLEAGELASDTVIVPNAAVDELDHMARSGGARAREGLAALQRMREALAAGNLDLVFSGPRLGGDAAGEDVRRQSAAIIRRLAASEGAELHTEDGIQSRVASAEGIRVRRRRAPRQTRPWFAGYFDATTMSVHLKEGLPPAAKRGTPGDFELVRAGTETLTREDLRRMHSAVAELGSSALGTTDMSLPGALVVQYEDYRIAATSPPFSEVGEITIVHPTTRMSLEDYGLSDKLGARLASRAEGILIAGAPGSGKSTLASALANSYHASGKTVKTFESPRDLQVDQGITQYSRLGGSFENSADILLLVRPDYTVFDEVRRREDFAVFTDLRLAGVGMVGVVHASSPLDAVQRFIGKIELGIIPHVLDTVVFVERGRVGAVYSLELKVKVPSGMTEQDLARPVIEVRDFESDTPVYEIYAFGEENMIVPVADPAPSSGIDMLAQEHARRVFKRYDADPVVEVLSPQSIRVAVSKASIAPIIGRGGSNISELERELRVHVDVVEKGAESNTGVGDDGVPFTMSESGAFLMFDVGRQFSGLSASMYSDGERLASARVDRRGRVRVPRRSALGGELARRYSEGGVKVVVRSP